MAKEIIIPADTKNECAICSDNILSSGGDTSTGLCLKHELIASRRGMREVSYWNMMRDYPEPTHNNFIEAMRIINQQ